jgi:hypothetical protein
LNIIKGKQHEEREIEKLFIILNTMAKHLRYNKLEKLPLLSPVVMLDWQLSLSANREKNV